MTDKKAEPGRQTSETQRVADLLTSILNDVQKQVQSEAPKPLEGKAVEAVELFREIGAALELQRRPTIITLEATPTRLNDGEGTVTLNWSSNGAQTVSIVQKEKVGGETTSLGEELPPDGSIPNILVLTTTIFTATAIAKGLCSSEPRTVEVPVGNVVG